MTRAEDEEAVAEIDLASLALEESSASEARLAAARDAVRTYTEARENGIGPLDRTQGRSRLSPAELLERMQRRAWRALEELEPGEERARLEEELRGEDEGAPERERVTDDDDQEDDMTPTEAATTEETESAPEAATAPRRRERSRNTSGGPRSAPETEPKGSRRRRTSRSAPTRIKCQRCGVRVSAGAVAQRRHAATCAPRDEVPPEDPPTRRGRARKGLIPSPSLAPSTPDEALAAARAALAPLTPEQRKAASMWLAATIDDPHERRNGT